jgi:predicted transcriptional regulator of viral defense system
MKLIETINNKYENIGFFTISELSKMKYSYAYLLRAIPKLAKDGQLSKIGKGKYSIIKNGKFGSYAATNIFDYYLNKYTKEKKGFVYGINLENKIGLTLQTAGSYQILTNVNLNEKRIINNVLLIIRKSPIRLTDDNIKCVEFLYGIKDATKEEIVKNMDSIKKYLNVQQDIEENKIKEYAKQMPNFKMINEKLSYIYP